MAAPYCTLTGTIPGGENGRATVRIIPDVKGATATVDGAAVSMREHRGSDRPGWRCQHRGAGSGRWSNPLWHLDPHHLHRFPQV
nr:MAG TPA: hypothetical protein [Caudoviricetes sp.]